MWDSMMSQTERDRYRAGEYRGIKINDTGLVAGMMVSKGMRRVFFWGSLFVMLGFPLLCLFIFPLFTNPTGMGDLFLVTLFITTPWGLWMFSVWVKANYYRWIGKKAMDNYHRGKLFDG